MSDLLSQPCAHPDAPAHHTLVRTRDGYAHICTEVPAQQEWIDALLLLAEGLSTKSGCVDQGEERCQPRSPSLPGRSTSA